MLDGLKVIEIEGIGLGFFVVMMFVDLGVNVIVVYWEDVFIEGMIEKSLFDRGKKFVLLNLKIDEGKVCVCELIKIVDVFIEGLWFGVMEKFGFGFVDFYEINFVLVYGRVIGWG